MTTTINIDYYEELKRNSDKYIEKETPKKVLIDEFDWNICPKCDEGMIKNGSVYCHMCGQKLKW